MVDEQKTWSSTGDVANNISLMCKNPPSRLQHPSLHRVTAATKAHRCVCLHVGASTCVHIVQINGRVVPCKRGCMSRKVERVEQKLVFSQGNK